MYTQFTKKRFKKTHLNDSSTILGCDNNLKNKKTSGFTLIEIVVSIMLIAIFLVVFGPPIADMFKEVVNTSDNDESFNSAYNLVTYYGSTGNVVDNTYLDDDGNPAVTCDDTYEGDVTISLKTKEGTTVTGKDFAIPGVKFYYAKYDTGSFGNAKQLYFNDYYVYLPASTGE